MRLRWHVPLPGPISVGGSVPVTPSTRGSGGLLTGLLKLCLYMLLAEVWIAWWCIKIWYVLGVFVHRKATGRLTPIWSSRSRWW